MTKKPLRYHDVCEALAEASTVQDVRAIERQMEADPSAIREHDWSILRGAIEATKSYLSEMPTN